MTTEAGSVVGQRFGAFTFTSQVGKKQNTNLSKIPIFRVRRRHRWTVLLNASTLMAAACGAARPAKRRAARGELGAMEELEAQEEQMEMEEAPQQMEMTPRQMLLHMKENSSNGFSFSFQFPWQVFRYISGQVP